VALPGWTLIHQIVSPPVDACADVVATVQLCQALRTARIVGMEQHEDRKPEPTFGIEQILAPLKRNMPAAGDYGFDSIRRLGNAIPMRVQNDGDRLLELFLEPTGQDYWLQPGESVVVTSYGHWDSHPFETIHEPDRITVWCTSWFATVTHPNGQEVPGAHQRPEGAY
jgi:hypothetical protein